MRSFYSILLFVSSVVSAEVTLDAPLNFGEIVILNNNQISTLEIFNNGTHRNQGKILIINQGSPAVVSINNLAALTLVQIDVTLPINSASPIGEPLQIIQLGLPNQIRVDSLGHATLTFGGTLATTGNGNAYYDQATYQFFIPVDFTY